MAFRQMLQSSDNGWKAVLIPQPGKMYSLFFTLEAAGKISLYADTDTIAARKPTITPYAVQLTQSVNPTLIFGEGSNLDRVPHPNNAGVDKAYSFKYTKGDTLYLMGNQYGDVLKLVKATKNDHDSYLASGLKTTMQAVASYLSTVRFLYITPEPGKVIQFAANPISKGIYVTYLDNGAKFFGSDYAYSLKGIELKNAMTLPGYQASEIFWDGTSKKLYTLYNGARVDLQASPIPVIPMHYLLGSEYPAGTAVLSPNAGNLPGWSAKFYNLWLIDDNGLSAKNISLYYIALDLHLKTNTMDLRVSYYSDDKLVRAVFPYTFTKTAEGIFSFTPQAIDSSPEGENATFIKNYLPHILSVINVNRFRIEYYDAYEELGGVIPKYISVDDADLYFTGLFYQ